MNDELTKAEKLARAMDNVRSGGRDFNSQLAAQVSQELRAQAERIKTLESAAMDRLVAEGQRCDAMTPQEAAKVLLAENIEGSLAKSMAHFVSVKEWEGYQRGVKAYTERLRAITEDSQ
jgi:hypothetical protein